MHLSLFKNHLQWESCGFVGKTVYLDSFLLTELSTVRFSFNLDSTYRETQNNRTYRETVLGTIKSIFMKTILD